VHHALHRHTPELFRSARRDRATRCCVSSPSGVNGNPEVKGRAAARVPLPKPVRPKPRPSRRRPRAHAAAARRSAPEKFAQWMLAQKRVLLTDTTMRDAHQSLLRHPHAHADMLPIAPYYARMLPAAVLARMLGRRHLRRRAALPEGRPVGAAGQAARTRMPNILFQMLLRGSNAVGYTNYADNVVRHFVQQAAARASTCSACSIR
jgi:pyruvate carboxylase